MIKETAIILSLHLLVACWAGTQLIFTACLCGFFFIKKGMKNGI